MKSLKFLTVGAAMLALTSAASQATANTITVDSLTNIGPITVSGQNYEQYQYNARLSDEGSVVNGTDQFNISGIQGFVGFGTTVGLNAVSLTGGGGTTWNVTATTSGPFTTITAVYTGSSLVQGPYDPLLNISFIDLYKDKAPNLALWGSQDHNFAGDTSEAPVVAQSISAPDPNSGAPGTPLPAASVGGLALMGMLAGKRVRRAR